MWISTGLRHTECTYYLPRGVLQLKTLFPKNHCDPLMSARTIVLLCTYNEVENLPELFAQLGRYLPHADVLVVDDSSPDGTAAWVRAQPGYRPQPTAESSRGETVDSADTDRRGETKEAVESAIYLIQRGGKQGLGTATRDGLRWCLERSYDFIINLDADLSHPPKYAPVLLAACQGLSTVGDTACDVAIGSRYVAGGSSPGLPRHRRWISRLLNLYANWMLRLPVKDCSGSFRCYRVDALRKIDLSQLNCPGYGFLEELLVALHRSGARLAEYAIEFRARSGGHSKLAMSDAWGAMGVIHHLAFSRQQSCYRDE